MDKLEEIASEIAHDAVWHSEGNQVHHVLAILRKHIYQADPLDNRFSQISPDYCEIHDKVHKCTLMLVQKKKHQPIKAAIDALLEQDSKLGRWDDLHEELAMQAAQFFTNKE